MAVIRNDQVQSIRGTTGDDHLIHHRDPSITNVHSSIGLSGGPGNDTLEASTPYAGQVHMWGGPGNDIFLLDMTNFTHHQGHHAYGGVEADKFKFVNIEMNQFYKTGRIDDYDHSQDEIWIEETKIELENLPQNITLSSGTQVEVRIINYEQLDILGQGIGPQQVLVIDNKIFYAIEGAREKSNLENPLPGEEVHFFTLKDIEKMKLAPSVEFVDPQNFVPKQFYAHRDDLTLLDSPRGREIQTEDDSIHLHGGKSRLNDVTGNNWRGSQDITLKGEKNVINANTGNDTVYGSDGNDLIAGGIDNDIIYGGGGDNMIWGGSGDDTLIGGPGNDFLDGGFGNDILRGGAGNDTLVGGRGNDTLSGSASNRGEDEINRFHFAAGDGHDVIMDFHILSDVISFQDNVDASSITIYQNSEQDTVIFYGENNTITMTGITLETFKEQAEARMLADDPVIIITPDPELELYRELQIKLGMMDSSDASEIEIAGVLYGNSAFSANSPGGYQYGIPLARGEDDNLNTAPEARIEDFIPIKIVVGSEGEKSEHEDDEKDEREDEKNDLTCFVATAAYRDHMHPDVKLLRQFRDQWLMARTWGFLFIKLYWQFGPILAKPVLKSRLLSAISRRFISFIVSIIRKLWCEV